MAVKQIVHVCREQTESELIRLRYEVDSCSGESHRKDRRGQYHMKIGTITILIGEATSTP